MYVKVYLEDEEFLKFLAGRPCEGHFVSFSESHRENEVLVPRDRVEAVDYRGFFAHSFLARIKGD